MAVVFSPAERSSSSSRSILHGDPSSMSTSLPSFSRNFRCIARLRSHCVRGKMGAQYSGHANIGLYRVVTVPLFFQRKRDGQCGEAAVASGSANCRRNRQRFWLLSGRTSGNCRRRSGLCHCRICVRSCVRMDGQTIDRDRTWFILSTLPSSVAGIGCDVSCGFVYRKAA